MIEGDCDSMEVHHYESETIQRQSRSVERSSSDSRPPRRGTEIPGWYRQIYSEMGNPQSMIPTMVKHNRSEATSTRTLVKSKVPTPSTSPPLEITHFIRVEGSPNRPNTSNSYETESSRSSTPGRDNSMSPTRMEGPNDSLGGVIDDDEPLGDRQEYYPFRDAHHGKPLPGENGFMNASKANTRYGRRYESISPRPGSRMNHNESTMNRYVSKSPPRIKAHPHSSRSRCQSSSSPLSLSRSPNRVPPSHHYNHNRSSSVPPSAVKSVKKNPHPYTMIPEYYLHLRHIKVTSIPVPIPPKFGTLTQGGRWPNEAQDPMVVQGPPCHLCKDPIAEPRFIHHETFIYHSWHFTCSHCFKTLAHDDFRMALNRKPYCNNCFKRQNTLK